MPTENFERFNAFLTSWIIDPYGAKKVFMDYKAMLAKMPGVTLSCKCRPGVSYSLRARNATQHSRELYVMIDIVDDDPNNRWLSVCFYADLVSDPKEKGDIAPEGLNGEDACCFNYDELNNDMAKYIADRLSEASEASGRKGAK